MSKQSVPTLDEWVLANAERLADDIACHLKVWEVDDPDGLNRMIMTSIRQWAGERVTFEGFREPLANLLECVHHLHEEASHGRKYDWNADPHGITLAMGNAATALGGPELK